VTTTGQCGWCRTAWLTEPSIILLNPARPWLPTTSSCAAADSTMSAAAGSPHTDFSTRSTPGKRERHGDTPDQLGQLGQLVQLVLLGLFPLVRRRASTSMSGASQVRTAVRPAPRISASSNANPTACSESGEPSVPTTIRPADGPSATPAAPERRTSTGQCACIATWSDVEPSIMLAKPPRPRAPSTSSWA